MALKYDEILKKYNLSYKEELTFNEMNFIERLFNSKIDFIDFDEFNNNSNILLWISLYYQLIKTDYVLMKKYYLMAIELGNSSAMNSLGWYYKNTEKNYVMMKKYLLMAIELNNSKAMNNLGVYYFEVKKDYVMMKKYLLMAIELNNSTSMNNLKLFYSNNKLELYKLLSTSNKKNKLINDTLDELKNNNNNIMMFNIKICLFKKLNNYTTCNICLETNVLNINLNCGHEICIDCYEHNMKCYYNWCLA